MMTNDTHWAWDLCFTEQFQNIMPLFSCAWRWRDKGDWHTCVQLRLHLTQHNSAVILSSHLIHENALHGANPGWWLACTIQKSVKHSRAPVMGNSSVRRCKRAGRNRFLFPTVMKGVPKHNKTSDVKGPTSVLQMRGKWRHYGNSGSLHNSFRYSSLRVSL